MPETFKLGETIYNFQGREVIITSIQRGRYGIALTGNFLSGNEMRCYVVPEIPVLEHGEQRFYEFSRSHIRMLSGMKISCFSFGRTDQRSRTPEEYDKAWEKSAEDAREQMMGIESVPGIVFSVKN